MRAVHTLILVMLAGTVVLPAARADGGTGEDNGDAARELRLRVMLEGGTAGEQAAAELFALGSREQDAFLFDVLSSEDQDRREARLCILRALRHRGRDRPEAACALVFEALDDPVPAVARMASDTFLTLEDELGRTFAFVRRSLKHASSLWARPGTPQAKKALALVEVLERMRNQIEATGILVEVLESRPGRTLEQKVRDTLQRMTAYSFDGANEWRTWYEQAREKAGGSLARWLNERANHQIEVMARYEAEAERFFVRLLTKIKDDPEALFQELTDALTRPDSVPAVRRRAITWLGTLAQQKNERAVALLRACLEGVGTDYDEDAALAIQQLGASGDPALLPSILPYLARTMHPRMRLAAVAALADFKERDAVTPLLGLLEEPTNSDELTEAVIVTLGRIGRNGEGRVSKALVAFARRQLLAAKSNGGAPASSSLLGFTAEALGRLPYVVGTPDAADALGLLTQLSAQEQEDANVRLYSVTALGTLPDPAAFQVLLQRLDEERVLRVVKAIFDAVGEQAVAHPEFVPVAVRRLAPFLDNPEETGALRRKSRANLERICDPALDPSLERELLLVKTIKEVRPEGSDALAGPLLAALPAPDKLDPKLEGQLGRYLTLLEVRARSRLAAERPAALVDLQALIQLGAPKVAFELARSTLQSSDPKDDLAEVWDVALNAVEAVKARDAAAAAALLEALRELTSTAPAERRKRYEALREGLP